MREVLGSVLPNARFDCSARSRSLRADRAFELAYFVVARRR